MLRILNVSHFCVISPSIIVSIAATVIYVQIVYTPTPQNELVSLDVMNSCYIESKMSRKQTSVTMKESQRSRSPFQRQLPILQNTINNWHTLREKFSDLRAETLSQTGMSCSYVLYVIIAKYVPFQRRFYDNKKKAYFL